jgi:ABC-type transport system involved in cytochrome bd biosynthesis fused ATPase/permease subunit
MLKTLQGQWPIMVFVLMFFVLPMATIPGFFDPIFIVLGGFTLVILGLIVAALFATRSKAAPAEANEQR